MDPSSWRTLRLGMSGPDVREWKELLLAGDTFDPVTDAATRQWQRERKLSDDGVVGRVTRGEIGLKPSSAATLPPPAVSLPYVKLIPAMHQRAANRKLGAVSWVVIHSAETSVRPSSAEALGAYFKDPKRLNNAGDLVPIICSAHYSVDSDSIVQHVLEEHVAFHVRARPTGSILSVNDRSIGIELTGRASQSREEWLDDYGRLMLPLAAKLTRRICDRWGLPLDHVGPSGLLANAKGITSHVSVRDAWKQDTHYDPGPNFPWDVFLDLVQTSERLP